MKKSLVYVIAGPTGATKVGITSGLPSRISALKAKYGRCKVRFKTDYTSDASKIERIAHSLLSDVMMDDGREWFECSTAHAVKVVNVAIEMLRQRPVDPFRVREWRLSNGIKSQTAAGRVLGRYNATVRDWELGKAYPSMTTRLLMTAIADGYKPKMWPM